jgi:hypothetical protein
MQVLGGIGYTTDFPIQAIFRNARLMRIGAGSDEIMTVVTVMIDRSEDYEAERFAAELRRRTGDREWFVYRFENPGNERGPVAPLEIASVPEQEGYTYYLTPASRERVVSAFPGTKLPGGLNVAVSVQQDYLRDKGEDWWLEISRLLTGRTDEEIDSLGGVRIIVGEDTVAFRQRRNRLSVMYGRTLCSTGDMKLTLQRQLLPLPQKSDPLARLERFNEATTFADRDNGRRQ